MKAADWIDRVKSSKGLPSDYAAAKELGLSRALVSKYRGPTVTFDEETALKVAQALDLNPAIVLADQAMERAKNADARSAWESVLKFLMPKEEAPVLETAQGPQDWRKRRNQARHAVLSTFLQHITPTTPVFRYA